MNTDAKTVMVPPEQMPPACPNPQMPSWSSHPKVFIKLDAHGAGRCHYCGTAYQATVVPKQAH